MRIHIAALAIALLTQRVHAQGVIDGSVTDSSMAPLSGVTISIVGSTLQVTTNGNGRFRLLALPAGRYALLLQKLGYRPVTDVLTLAAGDTIRPSFELSRVVHTLDTVAVAARTTGLRLTEFEERRKYGEGQFMTRADIVKRNSVTIIDLLRTFQGITIGENGKAINRRSPSIMGRACYFQYHVDGIQFEVRGEQSLPSPNEIAGIEVYQNSALVPPRYKSTSDAGFCGVILLWTRDGSDSD